eukprot:1013407-Pelagomonas_calceolata.AAC.1
MPALGSLLSKPTVESGCGIAREKARAPEMKGVHTRTHTHIHTQLLCSCVLRRGYAEKDAAMAFQPTVLGEALITGYRCASTCMLRPFLVSSSVQHQIHTGACLGRL